MEASPNRSARLAAHAQQQSLLHSSFPYFVLSSMILFSLQLFQNPKPFLLVQQTAGAVSRFPFLKVKCFALLLRDKALQQVDEMNLELKGKAV
jgi:hypothetical protein